MYQNLWMHLNPQWSFLTGLHFLNIKFDMFKIFQIEYHHSGLL